MTARQIELKRLVSEAKEMASRWSGMLALLNTAQHGSEGDIVFAVGRSANLRLDETVGFLVRIKLLAAKERR